MDIEPTILSAPPQQQSPTQDIEKKDVDDPPKQELQSPKESNNDTNSGLLGRGFDLNTQSVDVEIKPLVVTASAETKPEEYPGWSISDLGNIDPMQLASMGKRLDEDEEDYDEEEA